MTLHKILGKMEWSVSRDTHVSRFVIKASPPYTTSLFLSNHPIYICSWPVAIKKQLKYSYVGLPGYDIVSYSHNVATTFRRKCIASIFISTLKMETSYAPSKILSPPTRQNYGVYGSFPKGQSQILVYVYLLTGYLPNIQLKFYFLCVFTVSVLKSGLILQLLSI